MNVYFNLFAAAAANLARYRLRSVVVVICLVAICGPYVTGIAISEGIRTDAEVAVQEGADLYLTLDHFGRNGPVPLHYLQAFRGSPNVTAVAPRIVGRALAFVNVPAAEQGDAELVVILGLEPSRMRLAPQLAEHCWGGSCTATPVVAAISGVAVQLPPQHTPSAEQTPVGEPPSGEVMIGSALADHLGLRPGQQISLQVADVTVPFRVSAIFPRNATIWSAQLVCMTLDDAAKLFALPGYASDFLIYCRPGPGNIQAVRQDALKILGDIPYRLQTKAGDVASYVDKGFRHQQGVFTVLFLVAFAVGIPALLIASGLGLSERRREIGICKAVGWQTTDLMLMVTFEQLLLSVIAACLAVLTSFVWVRAFNGVVVAQFFVGELGSIAPFQVPARFALVPFGLALLLCCTITMVGGLYTTWRLAARPPAEDIR